MTVSAENDTRIQPHWPRMSRRSPNGAEHCYVITIDTIIIMAARSFYNGPAGTYKVYKVYISTTTNASQRTSSTLTVPPIPEGLLQLAAKRKPYFSFAFAPLFCFSGFHESGPHRRCHRKPSFEILNICRGRSPPHEATSLDVVIIVITRRYHIHICLPPFQVEQ